MLFRAVSLATLALLAASGDRTPAVAQVAANPQDPGAWVIGPMVRGRNYSHGMPLHPTPRRNGGWYFDFPKPPGSVHAVTFRHGPLAGKRRIVMRYRVEMAPGARIAPPSMPHGHGMITLYFQRRGDNWSGKRAYEGYRWYATFATQTPITVGDHVMAAPLNGNWTAVEGSQAWTNTAAFRAAIAEADQVGFVLGGGDGYGHGVYATGRARLTVTEFRVE